MRGKVLELRDCTELADILDARPSRAARMVLGAFSVLLLTGVGWAQWTTVDLVVRAPGRVRPLDSVSGDTGPVSGERVVTEGGGRIVELRFREGDSVASGQTLMILDTVRIDYELKRLEATLRSDEEEVSRLQGMEKAVAEQEAAGLRRLVEEAEEAQRAVERDQTRRAKEIERAQSELQLASLALDHERQTAQQLEGLVERGVESAQRLRDARRLLKEAEMRVEAARKATDVSDADIRVSEARQKAIRRQEEILKLDFRARRDELRLRLDSKRGALRASAEVLKRQQYDREQGVVRAPVSGVVTQGSWHVGDFVEPGRAIAYIAPGHALRIDSVVAASDVGLLRKGMKARLLFDAYDFRDFGWMEGTLLSISPDAILMEGTAGARSAAFLVRIGLPGEELVRGTRRGRLRLGMTAQVEIVTDQERVLKLFFRKTREKIGWAF